ncbi:uncharacterized protein RMCC_1686 [Mycolicibacterium canariasense]|uniref:Uncharacterized protein n=1 Tax=Mycolicibacterium canariasense TaxID=228230 RepID=A0A100WAU2_MYCCR|nr:hypothetical protein [Mycolicibacterium canariasense]MCV7208495.1 hypothetical protein [Mycolicibacterium canariasense]ORV07398.1 hypothetical protein AWB94_15655 [Mycolicibacterium canariasense]GAS94720.1 uncharacterized protein RMCC_1686 [Mycolicibacterium canariasense]
MTVALAILILLAPFALAIALGWLANRSRILRLHLDQFRVPTSAWDRLFDTDPDPDASRLHHDLDAIRTRFEQAPSWPTSGVLGERR